MVKKVITKLDSSKASGCDCIPVVVLQNCEPELSYIPAELFNKCLKESCFPDCSKVSLVVPVFKNVGGGGRGIQLRTTILLVFFLLVFQSLKNKQIIGLLISQRSVAFFSDFQSGFRSSQSTTALLTTVSNRIAGVFNSLELLKL